jgi:two-component system cell cycle sensor histidine kinase/response regulator CckA
MQQMLETLLGSGVRLTTNLSPDAGFVRLDAGYFHQVLLNLVINARDAMPHGGLLTVATSNVDVNGPQPQVNGVPPGAYVQLTVADNGCGMPPSVREHLFEPFFTTKEPGKGTGLGLATVYGIITQSGGHILVDTEAGRGTAFRIYLPRVVEASEQAEKTETHTLPTGMETLLLVEDREDVRRLVAKILRDLGYTVLEAPDAKRAVELNREHKGKIDLLVANMEIPELPLDELAELVKTFQPGINVLCLSSTGDPNAPEAGSDRGFGCLQKPFSPLDLAVKVRQMLDQR